MIIQDLLEDLKVDYIRGGDHHCRTGWIQLRHCPFCGSDKYHLGINLQLSYTSCWSCGGHHLAKLLEKLGIPRNDAWKQFRGLDISKAAIKRERSKISLKEPVHKGPLLDQHRRYLERRGFDADQLQKIWGIEGIGIAPNGMSWRVYIPIIHQTQRVSWTSRSIADEPKQRYMSASADEETVNHKELIYGGDFCHHSVVVCEGPFDAWRVGPGAVALFGTAFSIAQVNKLRKIPNRFVCFDSEPEAQKKAKDLCNQLACFPGITENIQLDSDDPGNATDKEISQLRKIARL